MLGKAAELNPGSVLVRDGRFKLAKVWVRDFQLEKCKLGETLDAITEILYRGLPDAAADDETSILAHIGYVQVIRKLNNLGVFVDVKALFDQALLKSPNNVYANTIYARWLLGQRPMTVGTIKQAEDFFNTALKYAKEQKQFVRQLQFRGLEDYTYGYSDVIEQAALLVLIKASIRMMLDGEPRPHAQSRNRILDGYGSMGKAQHVEVLVDELPAEAHLAVYKWFLQDDDDTREAMRSRSIYIKARLNEKIGDQQVALDNYRSLLVVETRKELQQLVNNAIHRLTGKLPARAAARNFYDDPVNEENLWLFHIDTLQNFNPVMQGKNLEQALAFFESRASHNSIYLDQLIILLPEQIRGINEIVMEGDRIKKMDAYTSGFSIWHHDSVRKNLVSLVLLYAGILNASEQFEISTAQLYDVLNVINKLDDEWRSTLGKLEYELARNYAILAARNQNKQDLEQSIQYLLSAVNNGAVDHELVSWREIKNPDFGLLKDDKRYQRLIRGR